MTSVMEGFRLDGRNAVVTGGSKGLGWAMARALSEAGANVVICSRNRGEVEDAAAKIHSLTGGPAAGLTADVTDGESVRELAAACLARCGPVDILINNAGVNIRKPLPAFEEDDWDTVVDASLKGAFLCSRAFMPAMSERGWGRIVMMGSTLSHISIPGRAAYASAKAGMLGLTRTLALEGAASGVTVNCLCPGPFETPMNRTLTEDPAAYAAFIAKVPMGRWGQPEELGGAIVFLCSAASAYMTGTALIIDGGWTAQ